MLLIIFRCVLIFFILLILLRLMGKRQIGEMQPFELVITLIVADLACFPMTDSAIPLLYAVISLFAVFIIHQILILCSNKSMKLERVICGSPTMLIEKNKIMIDNMDKVHMTSNDLLENIRTKGFGGFEQIEFAFIETSGNISFIINENIKAKSFAQIVVDNGKTDKTRMKIIKFSENELNEFLDKEGVKLKDVYVLTVDYDKNIYYQLKEDKNESNDN